MGKRYLPIGKRASETTTISKNPSQASFNEAELAITDVGFTENTRKKQKCFRDRLVFRQAKRMLLQQITNQRKEGLTTRISC